MYENLKKALFAYGLFGKILFLVIMAAVYYIIKKYILGTTIDVKTDISNFFGYSAFSMAMQFTPLFIL